MLDKLIKIENIKDEDGISIYVTTINNRQGHYCDIRLRDCIDEKLADGWGNTKLEAIENCVNDFNKYILK